jgi:glycolate oxidase FAD binding subunit
MDSVAPSGIEEFADALRDAARVQFVGGRTKSAWGNPVDPPSVELSTAGLSQIVEHNAGDLTAVIEAGVKFSTAQEKFHSEGQMFAVDPPDSEEATIGGVVATGDSGPLRHRYGAVRDLVVGATLVLADGTIARSGGKVIKNVAGYDLAKLFSGSFGTLGLVARVAVRLHPLTPGTLTLVTRSGEHARLREAVVLLAQLPLELDSLDIFYERGRGEILARFGGADPGGRVDTARRALAGQRVETEVLENDSSIWSRQRNGQRHSAGAVVKVSGLPAAGERVMKAADDTGGRLVGRAAMGLSWIAVEGDDSELVVAIEAIRAALPEFDCVVQDAPEVVRRKIDVWGGSGETLALMQRLKQRFDPTSKCNRGLFVGGI